MLYDCFIFDNELMMLEVRLNTLSDVVDKFILVESTHTFTGMEKKLCYWKHQDDPALAPFKDKIVHVVYQAEPVASAWANEASQRNAIMDGLKRVNMQDDDIVFICDVDEIWRPEIISELDGVQGPHSLDMGLFYYAFNCKKVACNWGPGVVVRGREVQQPQSFRGYTDPFGQKVPYAGIIRNAGWHFSCVMTPEDIRKKLMRFSHTEFSGPPYTDISYIEGRIRQRNSLIGEGPFTVVPLDAPRYVMENQQRFAEFIF